MATAASKTNVKVTAVAVELPSLSTRIGWCDDWEENTRDSQELARRDRAYYDNDQWTREEIEELEGRHQPVLTKNRIARKVNYILGEEIRKRVDPVARPRTPQHEDAARAATDALRYVEEEQEFDQARSAVLKNMLIEGYGGAIKGAEQDEEGKIYFTLRHVEWDRLFYDPHSRAHDFSDAKYLGVVVWMDLDDAILQYPDGAEALRAAVAGSSYGSTDTTEDIPRKCWGDRKRNRVKIVEMYFQIAGDFYRANFTQGADLEEPARTDWLDERGQKHLCPLLMESCYVDQEGCRYGVVRQLISPQDEVNKRASKALHLLSVNGVIAEDNTITDPTKFQIELAKPDGFATGVTPGALQEGRVVIRDGGQLAQGQLQLLQEAKQDIDTIGPSSATMPDLPESASGRAFQARQQAAAQELGTIFDQLRAWTKRIYQLDWCGIRQYWTEETWLRVTDDQEDTGYRFVSLNQPMTRGQRYQELLQKKPAPPPEKALKIAAGEWAPIVAADVQAYAAQAQQYGQQVDPAQLIARHPAMAEQITVNQVEQMLVDIVVDMGPETAVLAQEEFATLSELFPTIVQAKPDSAGTALRLLIKASSLPNKRELLQELEKGPDPAQQQQAQQAQQLAQAAAQAKVAVDETRAQLQQAQTAKTAAEAQVVVPQAAAKIDQSQAQSMAHAATAGAATAEDHYGQQEAPVQETQAGSA